MGIKGKSKYSDLIKEGDMYGHWIVVDPSVVLGKEAKVKCLCTKCRITQKLVSCYTLVNGVSTCCYDCGNKKNIKSGNPS